MRTGFTLLLFSLILFGCSQKNETITLLQEVSPEKITSFSAEGKEARIFTTARDTDFWRRTAYGFIHDDGHFLGAPLGPAGALEVTFRADLEAQFDQAGLMLRAGPETWLKTGVELSDGQRYRFRLVAYGALE